MTEALFPQPKYLPAWHNRWDKWHGVKVPSGCPTVDGRVQCLPENMRANAEAKLRELGAWTEARPLPLATYTLARGIASEVGSGTPEEKVAVAEAYGINAVRLRSYSDVNRLLLYRVPGSAGYGYYGPIHACAATDPATGKCIDLTAPFGRFAATSADPTVEDLLIADFALQGKSNNFARGADDQYGPGVETPPGGSHPPGWAYNSIPIKAEKSREYWVGPLPGVDHWHTFLFRTLRDVEPSSLTGQALISLAQQVLAQRPTPWIAKSFYRPDWSRLPIATSAPVRGKSPAVAFAGIALFLAFSAGTGLVAARYAEEGNWNWLKFWRRTA